MDAEFYEKAGRIYDRVTRILDYFQEPELVAWKLKVGPKEASRVGNKALRDGTKVDAYCEQDFLYGCYDLRSKDNQEVKSCMRAWEQWKQDWPGHFKDIREAQRTVFYEDWMVAGTMDFRLGTAILDIKTSRFINRAHWIQLAVYNRDLKKRDLRILDLSKKIGDYVYAVCQYPQDYLENLFIGRLINYRFAKEEIWEPQSHQKLTVV